MKIAIIGTGGVALGYAARLAERGHAPILYSHSGKGVAGLEQTEVVCEGKIALRFQPQTTTDLATALADADGVVIAIPANRHRAVMDAMAPLLKPGQNVLVSAELSLSGSHLARILGDRKDDIPVSSLSTTVLMGRRTGPSSVTVGAIRNRVEVSTLPETAAADALAFWKTLFGDMLCEGNGPIAIALSNLNPSIHMASALCNFTRIEKAEYWCNYDGITPGVANLIKALDAERLAVALAYGVKVRDVEEHYRISFGFEPGLPLATMAAKVHEVRKGPPGPVSTDTRFVTEDVPFGIVCIERLARDVDTPVPLHSAGIDIFSAIYGRDFRSENSFAITGKPA